MESLVFPLILFGVVLLFGAIFLIITSAQNKKHSIYEENGNKEKKPEDSIKRREEKKEVNRADVFDFMEFERILDDMIVQDNGTKFTMAVKCKGINYDLMSEVEKISVEEGFTTFLNTLRFPIQFYVQAQNIDLKKTIGMYNERIDMLKQEQIDAVQKHSYLVNNLESTDEEILKSEYEEKNITNVLEYANDIIKYVERMSLNKTLLQRNFYILVSYYSSEITAGETFNKDEIIEICYTELYTRALGIISSLSNCSVSSHVLTSNELAQLLYTSYNRDDANCLSVQQALDSVFYRLYSTSEDAFRKKRKILQEKINNEAELRAYESIKQAIENGELETNESVELEIEQEIARKAIEVVNAEPIEEKHKVTAKKIIKKEFENIKNEKLKVYEEDVKQVEEEVKTVGRDLNEGIQKINRDLDNVNIEAKREREKLDREEKEKKVDVDKVIQDFRAYKSNEEIEPENTFSSFREESGLRAAIRQEEESKEVKKVEEKAKPQVKESEEDFFKKINNQEDKKAFEYNVNKSSAEDDDDEELII